MTAPATSPDLIEALAAEAHEAWRGWMRYLFEKCESGSEGTRIIPAWAVERWLRQADTEYADLPDDEKESDRDEARRYLRCLQVTKEGRPQ